VDASVWLPGKGRRGSTSGVVITYLMDRPYIADLHLDLCFWGVSNRIFLSIPFFLKRPSSSLLLQGFFFRLAKSFCKDLIYTPLRRPKFSPERQNGGPHPHQSGIF